MGSGNEVVDYSRAPCLGADQKGRELWDRDCVRLDSEHVQSDGKSVNRGLPVLDLARGRDSWC